MGDANRALMDRIFGKLDASGNNLSDYGSLTMIVKMVEDGYMSLANTNIISAKYAFELSKEELAAAFPGSSEDEIVLRAKLATLRFWPTANQMFARLPAIFTQRMINMKAVEDLATIFGKDVDIAKIQSVSKVVLANNKAAPELLKDLSQDDRSILVQYLTLYNLLKTNNQQYQQYVSNIMQQSVL